MHNFWRRYEFSVHVDNKKKDILILGEGPTQRLDGTTLTNSIHFTENNKMFCLSLHYNGSNIYLYLLMVQKFINLK